MGGLLARLATNC